MCRNPRYSSNQEAIKAPNQTPNFITISPVPPPNPNLIQQIRERTPNLVTSIRGHVTPRDMPPDLWPSCEPANQRACNSWDMSALGDGGEMRAMAGDFIDLSGAF